MDMESRSDHRLLGRGEADVHRFPYVEYGMNEEGEQRPGQEGPTTMTPFETQRQDVREV